MEFVDFGLPHTYSGAVHREAKDRSALNRIPAEPTLADDDYLYIDITPETGRPWTAAVLREFGNGLLDGAFATPERGHMCVVSGGAVYLINTMDPGGWRRLDAVVPWSRSLWVTE